MSLCLITCYLGTLTQLTTIIEPYQEIPIIIIIVVVCISIYHSKQVISYVFTNDFIFGFFSSFPNLDLLNRENSRQQT